jgi:hypothetical protein
MLVSAFVAFATATSVLAAATAKCPGFRAVADGPGKAYASLDIVDVTNLSEWDGNTTKVMYTSICDSTTGDPALHEIAFVVRYVQTILTQLLMHGYRTWTTALLSRLATSVRSTSRIGRNRGLLAWSGMAPLCPSIARILFGCSAPVFHRTAGTRAMYTSSTSCVFI